MFGTNKFLAAIDRSRNHAAFRVRERLKKILGPEKYKAVMSGTVKLSASEWKSIGDLYEAYKEVMGSYKRSWGQVSVMGSGLVSCISGFNILI